MKLVVVSICHNEAKTIGDVLDSVPEHINGISQIEKWVIDDGSSDGTAKIAVEHGAHVISDGAQKRLAFRFREALDLALSRQTDVLVNIDGDMQFNPKDIPLLVKPIVDGKADFVAADRFTDPQTKKIRRPKNMPLAKYIGNRIGAKIVSKLSNQSFRDVTCGFRAYNRDALFALNISNTHTYTQESFQVLAVKKKRIESIPITVKYYPERKSRVVTSIVGYIFNSALTIIRSFRDFAPLKFFMIIAAVPFVLGLISSGFTVIHWLITGEFTPYKFLGFAGLYGITLGIFFFMFGLLADMQVRLLRNQEKIIEDVLRVKYSENRTKAGKK